MLVYGVCFCVFVCDCVFLFVCPLFAYVWFGCVVWCVVVYDMCLLGAWLCLCVFVCEMLHYYVFVRVGVGFVV